jgi:hypothetical protein
VCSPDEILAGRRVALTATSGIGADALAEQATVVGAEGAVGQPSGPDLGEGADMGLAALVAPSRWSPCHLKGDLLTRRASGTKGRVRRSGVLLLSIGFGLPRMFRESCQGGVFCSAAARSRMPGRRPRMMGTLWVGGRA